MLLHLTDLSDEPLQQQIIRQIRAHILSGELPAHADLPSIRELASQARVSVITVQRAYEALLDDELIYARRGKGYFVSATTSAEKRQLAEKNLKNQLPSIYQRALNEGLPAQSIRQISHEIIEQLINETEEIHENGI